MSSKSSKKTSQSSQSSKSHSLQSLTVSSQFFTIHCHFHCHFHCSSMDETSVQFSDIVISNNTSKSLSPSKDNKECIICCSSYSFTHPPLRLSCCNQFIGHDCFSKYAIDRKRSFLKHNQTLSGFSVSCLFCNGCPEFSLSADVKEGSLLSTPSTINTGDGTSDVLITPSSQVFSEFQHSDNHNHIICECYCPIDNTDQSISCGCCDKCFIRVIICSKYEILCLPSPSWFSLWFLFCWLHMLKNRLFISFCFCRYKSSSLMACTPHSNYLLSVLTSYACGATYNKGNPWKAQDLILKYPDFKTLSDRLISLLSHADISHLRNDVQRNLKNFRNVFVPSSTMLEFLSRDPQLQRDVCSFITRFILMLVLFTLLHTPFIFKKFMYIISFVDGIQVMWCVFFSLFYTIYISLQPHWCFKPTLFAQLFFYVCSYSERC